MKLTSAALWLNRFFSGYDSMCLGLQHRLAGSFGAVLTPLMKLVTLLGEKGLLLILLSLALMCFRRTRWTGVCVFGAVACGAVFTNFLLKDAVARPRPFETVELYRQWWQMVGAPAEEGFSFPSGHVTAAAAGLTGLCLSEGRGWVLPSFLWVLLMAASRNYLMAHYPSDVLCAAVIGLISGLIAWGITLLLRRFFRSHRQLPLCRFVLGFDLGELAGRRRSRA